jgi:TrmH family RNA methyltransferase
MPCENLPEFLAHVKVAQNMQVLCTSLEDSLDYSQVDYNVGSVIVIGNESQGVSNEVFNQATQRIKIPIYGEAESLNAAIAAAVIMYEAIKHRR